MPALEMEEEERDGLINGGSTVSPPKSSGGYMKFIYGGAVVLLLVLHFSGFTSPSSDDDETKPIANGPKTPSQAAAPNQAVLEPELTKEESSVPLIYSKISEIPPNPDHKAVDEDTREKLSEKWGKWHFWDGDEDNRPVGDYCGQFANRDIPGDHFPDDAWQVDAVFVNHLLNDAEKLLSRAQEAIFTEVGHPKPLPPEGLAERLKMFKWDMIDLAGGEMPQGKSHENRGGWTTDSSYDGLVRRLLHAMMTNDKFVVVVGGHSAAAGHGNHFHQSYAHRFHAIMAPIFARLGVKLETYNLSMGGVGTIQHSLGSRDIYGSDIDLLIWDSGMTEPSKSLQSVFVLQALMSPGKIPVIWGPDSTVLAEFFKATGADVGDLGRGLEGIPIVTSQEQAETLPYALRYMKCSREAQEVCTEQPRFCATCWIKRDDIDTSDWPEMNDHPGSQVTWHPGWRMHQLRGHVLAFSILDALQTAIQRWSEGTMGGPPLDDEEWHLSDHYNSIREKVKKMGDGLCSSLSPKLSPRVCKLSLHGATQHTPRRHPNMTSLTSMIKPTASGYVPYNSEKMLYEGPDVPNPCFEVPDEEPDIWAIVSGRRLQSEVTGDSAPVRRRSDGKAGLVPKVLESEIHVEGSRSLGEKIVPGKGWQVSHESPGGVCDGGYNSYCGRTGNCPLYGHHDSRGVVAGTGLSGWVVFTIPRVQEGFILLKLYTWPNVSPKDHMTQSWTSVNNEGRRLRSTISSNRNTTAERSYHMDEISENTERKLGGDPFKDVPESLVFEYAINGKVTSLNREQLKEKITEPARVVQLLQLLDDPSFPSSDNVELAIRLTGCGNDCIFSLTHLYWA